MPFVYPRMIQFRDTDAAGVVYFANVLSICHEAYEASLIAAGIELRSFFSTAAIAIPITSARVDFFKPMFCGDRIEVQLTPIAITEQKFSVAYQIAANSSESPLAKAVTEHLCIDRTTRRRQPLTAEVQHWLQLFNDTDSH